MTKQQNDPPKEPKAKTTEGRSRRTPNDALAVEATHTGTAEFGILSGRDLFPNEGGRKSGAHGTEPPSTDPVKTTFRGENSK
ncbi:hypothetical protein ACFYN3_01675 [Streptomyces lavendulae]|uniref:hypothetical protein n=1 Tax=Streptomyces lavendulae TaxID=1914 RepID=UPI00369DAD86